MILIKRIDDPITHQVRTWIKIQEKYFLLMAFVELSEIPKLTKSCQTPLTASPYPVVMSLKHTNAVTVKLLLTDKVSNTCLRLNLSVITFVVAAIPIHCLYFAFI